MLNTGAIDKKIADFNEHPEHFNNDPWDLYSKCKLEIPIGDSISYMGSLKTKEVISRLNGRIILIQGNHDQKPHRYFEKYLPWLQDIIGKEEIKMSHYPYRGTDCNDVRDFSDRQLEDRGCWLLHGHVHCLYKQRGKMINVGVDQWHYTPVSEEEIISLMGNREGGD